MERRKIEIYIRTESLFLAFCFIKKFRIYVHNFLESKTKIRKKNPCKTALNPIKHNFFYFFEEIMSTLTRFGIFGY